MMVDKGSRYEGGQSSDWLGREIIGLIAIFFGLLLILSLATFDPRDPYLNQVVTGVTKVHNKAGLFGSYVGGILLDTFGVSAWIIPLFFCLFGTRRILTSPPWPWWRWVGVLLLGLCVSLVGAARDVHLQSTTVVQTAQAASHGGGLLGYFIYTSLVGWLSKTGTILLGVFSFLLSVQLLVGFSWVPVVIKMASGVWTTCTTVAGDVATHTKPSTQGEELYIADEPAAVVTETAVPAPIIKAAAAPAPYTAEEAPPRSIIAGGDAACANFGCAPSTSSPFTVQESDIPVTHYDAEDDLPSWVEDFEQGRLGINALENGELEEDTVSIAGGLPYIDMPDEEERHDPLLHHGHDTSFATSTHSVEKTLADEQHNAFSGVAPSSVDESLSVAIAAPKGPLVAAESTGSLLDFVPTRRVPLPSIDLLEPAPVTKVNATKEMLESKGKVLMTCLSDFGISCELVAITPGPVVTMFEVRPAPGVRVSRIANLSDDLALALKAVSVRIQAPVPGSDTVGIEIPNDVRETVCFKELINSQLFQKASSLLTLALGKDISGDAAIADLSTMPHLLMAGATGAGKSVGINSILLSFLYKARPDEVKLLLIDPKRVEMAIYSDLPHLVHPVVTDMAMAKNALDWAVSEMERRYEDIARCGVRNITDYNAKLKAMGKKRTAGLEGLQVMPYLVIIIDELADLMLVAAREVETSIVRLAQLARAAGIHLILATQRPSVDVVTGIIKANFPSRISFQVTSKHDSRTILDTVGAEHLLGKGDMLYKPGGAKSQRLHGAFVSDKNVLAICDYWRSQLKPVYSVDFAEWGTESIADAISPQGPSDISADPLYAEACEFVRQQGKVSISLVQRRFRIGFNKAANFVDQMEKDGIIGAADGSKPRFVFK